MTAHDHRGYVAGCFRCDLSRDEIAAKVEASSFGTPEAQALRATVSDEHAAKIVARAKELEDTAEKDADPRWVTRPGDRFLPYAATIWMNEHDHGWNYRVLDHSATTLPRAIKRGLAMNGSDDFNIAAIRGGRMVAALWMEEVVDDDPLVIDGIAEALGLAGVTPPAEPEAGR